MFKRWRVVPSEEAAAELEKANLQLLEAEEQAEVVKGVVEPLRSLRAHNHLGERMGLAYKVPRRGRVK